MESRAWSGGLASPIEAVLQTLVGSSRRIIWGQFFIGQEDSRAKHPGSLFRINSGRQPWQLELSELNAALSGKILELTGAGASSRPWYDIP